MFTFRTNTIGKRNKKIIFLICGWPGKIWYYYLTAKVLEYAGYQSIIYEYDSEILTSSIGNTIKNTRVVVSDILNKIKSLKKGGHEDFSIFGTSYGTIIAFIIANKEKNISKLIINLTSGSLAEAVWSWTKGNGVLVKEGIVKQNISLKSLEEEWAELSPINQINNLKKVKILFYLAKKDEVIPFRLQTALLTKLKKINHDVQTYTDGKLNHLTSALFNLLRYKRYTEFLSDYKD